ncbi:MAG: alkaline phosphatase family protein [Solirubrobacterales bacterium]
MSRRFVLAVAILAAFVAGVIGAQADPSGQTVPKVKHVFIIVLENENADQTFGPQSQIPYLADTMRSEGAYIPDYWAIGHLSLDNYIAMVSGQAPNAQTQADCQFFTDFLPGTPTSNGQYIGQGCLYPPGVQNIATQLEGNGWTWKGYMQDMDLASTPSKEETCRHPDINSQDHTQSATPQNQYAARHNPFVYFQSIIDFDTCKQNDVDLEHLNTDLGSEATTPNYSFITPDLCNDGHDGDGTPGSCADGGPGGMVQANSFLQEWVPKITNSAAFKDRGLLLVTFDEAEGDPREGTTDASACCNEQPGPNTINPGGPVVGPGGGKIGAVALSPCIAPGTVTHEDYNHYSLLRWVEDNFDLPHLGYAGQANGVNSFDAKVLSDPTCGEGGGGTTTTTTTSSTTTTTTTGTTTTTPTDSTTTTAGSGGTAGAVGQQPPPLCTTLRKKLKKAKKAGDRAKVRKLRRRLRNLGC